MQSLHDDDEGRLLRVVQTSSRQFLPPCQSRLAIGVAFRLFSIVRIVHDQNVPPIPSNEPPTDVASLEPPALVSNFVLVFWSSRNLKCCPHNDWYHGLRMSRRVELLLVSDKSWLYDPHRKRTCGPFKKDRCDCAHVHAGKKIDATVAFEHLGGACTKRWRICPSETACKCSHNASIAQQG